MNLKSHLSSTFMLDDDTIHKFAMTWPHRYKGYSIPKRNGVGSRTIAHPSKELKFFQREIVNYLDSVYQCHESAFAYVRGRGIKENALSHARNEYILKMDFKNFFPSITPELFFIQARNLSIPIPQRDKSLMRHFLFYKRNRTDSLTLSIGAPSSPIVSNICMHAFDEIVSHESTLKNIKYSRYADDITFSTTDKDILFSIPSLVSETLSTIYQSQIEVNPNKTIFSSKAHCRFVTGVTLTNQGGISIGRERKRIIIAMVHRFILNKLEPKEISKLAGLLAFAKHIEPHFLTRIDLKYGVGTSAQLLKLSNPHDSD